jgi:3-dehydroquinate synthase
VTRIRVSPAAARPGDYDVVIEAGALSRLAQIAREAAPAHRYAIISDSNVASLHGEAVLRTLAAATVPAELFAFEAGEANKTRATWERLSDELIARGYGRDASIIALGGGVTGDLAGFIAATFLRGVPVIQVPTSLLSMVDASIGGKTGVDTPQGKNLIGAFHQPAVVVIDTEVLATLPLMELRSGLAEAVKHAAIADAAYLQSISDSSDRLFARDPAALEHVVQRSVEIKARVVSVDPLEAGARQALNFGHTVGHALEALAYYTIRHGEAVAIGMVAECAIGELMGVTEPGTALQLGQALEKLGLPTHTYVNMWSATGDPGIILEHAKLDKKSRAGVIRATLISRIGEVARNDSDWTFPLDPELVTRALTIPPPSV